MDVTRCDGCGRIGERGEKMLQVSVYLLKTDIDELDFCNYACLSTWAKAQHDAASDAKSEPREDAK